MKYFRAVSCVSVEVMSECFGQDVTDQLNAVLSGLGWLTVLCLCVA